VGHSSLCDGKLLVGPVRPAPGIPRIIRQCPVNGFKISGGKHAIAVKYKKVVAASMPKPKVTGRSGTAVGFEIISQRQFLFKLANHLLRCHGGPILNNNHRKIFSGLDQQTFQQLL